MMTDYRTLITGTEHVCVVSADSRLLGVIVVVGEPDHLFIENLAIAPSAQGRGYGRTLLLHAEKHAAALTRSRIRLYTNAAMTENLAFYPRMGYTEVDRRTRDGFDRVYFSKQVIAKTVRLTCAGL